MSATGRFADGEPGIGKPWGITVVSSRLLKASVLVAVAIFIGVPILSPGNPVPLVAALTASQADEPTLQPATDESKPTVQSADVAEALPPIAEEPTRDEIAAALRSAHQSQLEKVFQAWVAEKDAKAQVRVQQDAPAAVAENAPTSLRPMKKNLRKVRSARAEIRAMRHPRKQVRREQNRPTQVSTSQDQTVQNPQPRSFLQILGLE